jgi:hypothetical protein
MLALARRGTYANSFIRVDAIRLRGRRLGPAPNTPARGFAPENPNSMLPHREGQTRMPMNTDPSGS